MLKKLLTIGLFCSIISCTEFQDSIKDLQSDTTGLKRDIKIYSLTGQPLASYSGNNVRVEFNEYGRFMANVDGKRLQVFNASVIIEEK